jgi:hypothetical protein
MIQVCSSQIRSIAGGVVRLLERLGISRLRTFKAPADVLRRDAEFQIMLSELQYPAIGPYVHFTRTPLSDVAGADIAHTGQLRGVGIRSLRTRRNTAGAATRFLDVHDEVIPMERATQSKQEGLRVTGAGYSDANGADSVRR